MFLVALPGEIVGSSTTIRPRSITLHTDRPIPKARRATFTSATSHMPKREYIRASVDALYVGTARVKSHVIRAQNASKLGEKA